MNKLSRKESVALYDIAVSQGKKAYWSLGGLAGDKIRDIHCLICNQYIGNYESVDYDPADKLIPHLRKHLKLKAFL